MRVTVSQHRRTDTPLRRQLAGTATVRPTALDAFRCARRSFLAGDRVDMQALARTLNVDRATLYRWVGSREELLTEILWSLIEPTVTSLRETYGQDPRPSPSPVAAVIMESYVYLGLITGEHPDPERAARVIGALLPGMPA